ncbi:MAG TPA: hypothetical protein PLO59_07005, partial [Bacteroidia bacterium]|nr:hypothetical protein [Bacteroidia bacterium]
MDKTVLIIAYYFPPVKGAAPWRPYSWCQYFGQQQLKTTVITRHWQGFESNWAQMTAPNFEPPKVGIEKDYTLIQLPTKAWCLYTFYRNYLFKIPGLSALFFAFAAALGRFGLEVDAYTTFAAYLINHLKTNNYDAIVVTYPPSNLLKLLPLLRKHSRAKIIVDFRDWLNNEMLQHNYKPGIKQQYLNYCQSCYAKKHL